MDNTVNKFLKATNEYLNINASQWEAFILYEARPSTMDYSVTVSVPHIPSSRCFPTEQ